MSREERIEKTFHNYYEILRFFKDNPDVLLKWKNKAGQTQPQAHQQHRTNSTNLTKDGDVEFT